MDSHSASCQLPGLSEKSVESKRVDFTGSALKEKREDSTAMRIFIVHISSVLLGDVTHSVAAIVEVCSPWVLLTMYANV